MAATPENLGILAKKCETTGENIAGGMNQLIQRIENLRGGGLVGATGTALGNASDQLNRGLTTILNALEELAGKINRAGSHYTLRDQDSARTITSAAGGDGGVLNILQGKG